MKSVNKKNLKWSKMLNCKVFSFLFFSMFKNFLFPFRYEVSLKNSELKEKQYLEKISEQEREIEQMKQKHSENEKKLEEFDEMEIRLQKLEWDREIMSNQTNNSKELEELNETIIRITHYNTIN